MSLALGARGLGKLMNEEKSTLAKISRTKEDIASSRVSFSKEECERILLDWWANYDPGMDAYLHSRAFSTSLEPPSFGPGLRARSAPIRKQPRAPREPCGEPHRGAGSRIPGFLEDL